MFMTMIIVGTVQGNLIIWQPWIRGWVYFIQADAEFATIIVCIKFYALVVLLFKCLYVQSV